MVLEMDLPGIHELLNIIRLTRHTLVILTENSVKDVLLQILREQYPGGFSLGSGRVMSGVWVHVIQEGDYLVGGRMIIFHAKIDIDYLATLFHEYNNNVSMFIDGECVSRRNVIWHEFFQEKHCEFVRCNNVPCLEKLA